MVPKKRDDEVGRANQDTKNPAAAELGRLRWKGLTPEEISEIQRKNIRARWDRVKAEKKAAKAKKRDGSKKTCKSGTSPKRSKPKRK